MCKIADIRTIHRHFMGGRGREYDEWREKPKTTIRGRDTMTGGQNR